MTTRMFRLVLPVPPDAPEPYEAPAYLDKTVFGEDGALALQGAGNVLSGDVFRRCPCGVSWRGDGGCWACGT